MNARERLLLVALVGIVGFGGFSIGTYVWFVKPFLANKKTIQTMKDENALEEQKWLQFKQERKKLELARLKSLPTNPNDAQSVYGFYLETSVRQSGLALAGVQAAAPTKMKPINPLPNVKDVGHQLMTFTVSARGELGEVVKLMEILQATPYEHRIRSVTLDRADGAAAKSVSKKLNVNMVIETLLVAKNENRPGHPPGVNTKCVFADSIAARAQFAPMSWALLGNTIALRSIAPPPPDRNYHRIADKNIFIGAIPIEKYVKPPTIAKKPPEPKPGVMPHYIKLVQTVPTQQEAYLINLFYKKDELKLSSNPKTGYQDRRITDENGKDVFMKVLRIDSQVVYFQVQDEARWIQLGMTLAEAMAVPALTEEEIDSLGLVLDAKWAKTQGGSGGGTKKKKGG